MSGASSCGHPAGWALWLLLHCQGHHVGAPKGRCSVQTSFQGCAANGEGMSSLVGMGMNEVGKRVGPLPLPSHKMFVHNLDYILINIFSIYFNLFCILTIVENSHQSIRTCAKTSVCHTCENLMQKFKSSQHVHCDCLANPKKGSCYPCHQV